MTENRSVASWNRQGWGGGGGNEWKRRLTKEHKKTLGSDEYSRSCDFGDDFAGQMYVKNYQIIYFKYVRSVVSCLFYSIVCQSNFILVYVDSILFYSLSARAGSWVGLGPHACIMAETEAGNMHACLIRWEGSPNAARVIRRWMAKNRQHQKSGPLLSFPSMPLAKKGIFIRFLLRIP